MADISGYVRKSSVFDFNPPPPLPADEPPLGEPPPEVERFDGFVPTPRMATGQPANLDTEMSVLATMLVDPSSQEEIFKLRSDDFYKTIHRKIFSVAKSIHDAGVTVDPVSLAGKCIEMGLNGDGITVSKITKFMDYPAAVDVKFACDLIRRASAHRQAIYALNNALQDLKDGNLSVDDIAPIIERTQKIIARVTTTGNAGLVNLVRLDSLELSALDPLIEDLFERGALAEILGESEAGKTFVAVAIAFCIAAGISFYGRETRQGPVCYFCGEGVRGIKRRFVGKSIRAGISLDGLPIYINTAPPTLCDSDQVQLVIDAIDQASKDQGPPVLVVFDTVSRHFGGDENSTADMVSFIGACDRIRQKYGCAVLLVHHVGLNNKERARGSSALRGALDAEFRLDRGEDDVLRLICTKMKDAMRPEPMAFRLRTVELGFCDDKGMPVTTAILDEIDFAAPPAKGKQGRGRWQTIAIEALNTLFDEHRHNLESKGFDPESARVTVDDWRDRCISMGMDRKQFHRVKVALSDQGSVDMEHGYVSKT